jgi:hypothetical protein
MFKKIAFLIVLASIGGILVAASAQPAKTGATLTNPSQTRFEQFSARNGGILVKEVANIATMPTRFGELTIEVIRLEDARSGEVAKAARLNFKRKSDRLEREYAGVIDESELDELLKALAFLDTQRERLNQFARTYTEMTYSSVGGFKAGIYIEPSDRPKYLQDYAKIDGESVFFLNATDFAKAMTEAQRVLKSM